ncbi:unnamed protein product [Psylliodes chrysocephalus]|uniref:ABC transporter domain-containing protein n=1 Tax=Psylliodes chrysocephalus TaxID=3402493 RepID=A0A9P0CJM5_9CUCU|nr:unnamed protein product [Psylliodes chrysocephala]
MKMHDYSVLVQDVVKNYGKTQILKKLCMKVETGQIYGLLGSSGCGKTTLLSAIVGRRKIESGEIWVLGGKPGDPGSGIPGPKVGYMPQETALVREFTVKDAIYYFGRIFNMTEKAIEERYKTLDELLNLPPENRYLKDCSGGQQRRVSFAVALVHQPKLLILDEPTVGIDPLLRERIWSYLFEVTKKEKISVIITTHYIEECRQADKIGLMRDGRLLTEDSPDNLLATFNTQTLEEVFLILSQRQEAGQLPLSNETTVNSSRLNETNEQYESTSVMSSVQSIPEGYKSTDMLTKKLKPNISIIGKRRMRALLDKNAKQFYRNTLSISFLLAMPILQLLLLLYSVGLEMRYIPIGIVNDESMSAFCPDFSIIGSAEPEKDVLSCHFHNLSCRFLKYHLTDPMITKVEYHSLKEATEDAMHGKVYGVMHFAQNFSEALELRGEDGRDASNETLEFSTIKVRLDMSNQQVGISVQNKLRNLYMDFHESLSADCNYPKGYGAVPVQMNYEYGSRDEDYQVFMIPGNMITMMFFFGATMTSQIMISEKHDGIWDRSIVAGVTSFELIASHLSFQGVIALFQSFEMIALVYIVYQYEYFGNIFLMYAILAMQGVCGMAFGKFNQNFVLNIPLYREFN